MAGVAQVWLSEDELDVLVRAVVRYVPSYSEDDMRTRTALLDKLRPLAYGTSCEVASGGGCSLELETRMGGCEVTLNACPGDELTGLK